MLSSYQSTIELCLKKFLRFSSKIIWFREVLILKEIEVLQKVSAIDLKSFSQNFRVSFKLHFYDFFFLQGSKVKQKKAKQIKLNKNKIASSITINDEQQSRIYKLLLFNGINVQCLFTQHYCSIIVFNKLVNMKKNYIVTNRKVLRVRNDTIRTFVKFRMLTYYEKMINVNSYDKI